MHDAHKPLTDRIHPGWFPLVPRSRPACRPLQDRIGELRSLLTQPSSDDPHRRLVRAAEVCNKAALIASDCGLPDLARTLCWRQHDAFVQARTLPATAVKLALQPLLNLPRQMIREGKGQQAHVLLARLYQASREQTDTEINGRPVNLRHLTRTPHDHKTTCTLIWTALLADGTRALALAGRWREAAEQASAQHGIGTRLIDGRQALILALIQEEQRDRAIALVNESAVTEPWEAALQVLLHALCRPTAEEHEQVISAMLSTALTQAQLPDPSLTVFHTRLGITALDLADSHNSPQRQHLHTSLIASAFNDAHAARTVLTHPPLRTAMTAPQRRDLHTLVDAAGLSGGPFSDALLDDLDSAASTAEQHLRELLS